MCAVLPGDGIAINSRRTTRGCPGRRTWSSGIRLDCGCCYEDPDWGRPCSSSWWTSMAIPWACTTDSVGSTAIAASAWGRCPDPAQPHRFDCRDTRGLAQRALSEAHQGRVDRVHEAPADVAGGVPEDEEDSDGDDQPDDRVRQCESGHHPGGIEDDPRALRRKRSDGGPVARPRSTGQADSPRETVPHLRDRAETRLVSRLKGRLRPARPRALVTAGKDPTEQA